jgi:hypothetical protein
MRRNHAAHLPARHYRRVQTINKHSAAYAEEEEFQELSC